MNHQWINALMELQLSRFNHLVQVAALNIATLGTNHSTCELLGDIPTTITACHKYYMKENNCYTTIVCACFVYKK